MLAEHVRFDLTGSTPGLIALGVFAIAYLLVVHEERLHLRKSKPVVLASGIIWILVAFASAAHPDADKLPGNHLEERILHHTGEYASLFLFLMVAMAYISAIAGHNVFQWLNHWLLIKLMSIVSVLSVGLFR